MQPLRLPVSRGCRPSCALTLCAAVGQLRPMIRHGAHGPSAAARGYGRRLSFGLVAPDEDMQTTGDDRSLSPALMERVQPGAAFGFGNRPSFDGYLGTALGQAGVEAPQISFEGKEAARSDVYESGALEEKRQLPD